MISGLLALSTLPLYLCVPDCHSTTSWSYEDVSRNLELWLTSSLSQNMLVVEEATGVGWRKRGDSRLDGYLYGKIDSTGEIQGDDVLFIYPDLETGLLGMFEKGELVQGRVVEIVGERCGEGIKHVEVIQRDDGNSVWGGVNDSMLFNVEQYATVMDPFEKKAVYVGESSIPGAGEGLFARRQFSPGDLVSYFNGWKADYSSMVFTNMTYEEMERALAFCYSIGRDAGGRWGYSQVRFLLNFHCFLSQHAGPYPGHPPGVPHHRQVQDHPGPQGQPQVWTNQHRLHGGGPSSLWRDRWSSC